MTPKWRGILEKELRSLSDVTWWLTGESVSTSSKGQKQFGNFPANSFYLLLADMQEVSWNVQNESYLNN
jgi:hypothetical protein